MNAAVKKNNNLRTIGIILFFVGAIAAIASAAKMPAEGTDFPSTVGIFSVALIMAIAGNLLWHKTERAKVLFELEEQHNSGAKNPIDLLKETEGKIEGLITDSESTEGMALCEKIDVVLDDVVHPFVEKSKSLMDLLGKEKGAEILLICAYGERMLNRAWSASSDGHPPEAKHSLDQALKSFKMANGKVSKYQS